MAHAARPGIGGRTPSDLDLIELSQFEIERLAPLQEGLLFHAIYDADAADVYIVQIAVDLGGPLDEPALKAAAGTLLKRHSILRAGFWQEGISRPAQVILADVPLPWSSVDLASCDETTRNERLAQFMAQDRAIVEQLNAALRAALASDDVRERIADEGGDALSGTPEQQAADIDAEETKWGAVVRKLGLKAE